ncbi:SURF1 family protein [Celeribacter ethanolicus]|uniref:SURF1-like protein n=1 Tax=Celeribacter ethanolicus TaxID=1758178 RepID=A0A291GH97_9RHOB|nr:SURF1 family protein [Celeribacter ethanolicus]ATG49903.1 SURF1 family protein [Celeribacter ethanolicus]TNE67493.1 MAG: SURF1 family protein [Paracoccaceae bacterium]
MIFPLVIGVLGCAILIALGTWQLRRLEWKQGVLAEIEAKIDAAPVSLPAVIDPSMKYLPVMASGEIGTDELHVLVSRKQVGAGYLIIVPFTTVDGRRVLLDRGFVPEMAKDAPRGGGPATVIGNLHWPDDMNSSTPAPDLGRNIWFGRDIPEMADALDTEPVLIVARESTGEGIAPMPVGVEGIPNDHLQYAITWFSLCLVWLGMTLFLLWRIRARTI